MGYVVCAVIIGMIVLSLKAGQFIDFGGSVRRKHEPRLFWAGIAFYSVVALASLWLSIIGKF